jgi:hypothetical protein
MTGRVYVNLLEGNHEKWWFFWMFLVISCDFTMRKGGKMVVELRKMVV